MTPAEGTYPFHGVPEPRRGLACKVHSRLHKLWTKSDGPSYDKKEWRELEDAINALIGDYTPKEK